MSDDLTAREALEQLKRDFGSALAAVPELQRQQSELKKSLEEGDTSVLARLKKQDDALADIVLRIQNGEKRLAETDNVGIRVDHRGNIKPRVSREFAEFGMKIFTGKARELSESVGADGAFLIQPEYRWQLQQLLLNYGVARQDCLIVPMGQPSMLLPNLVSGMRVYWTGENATAKNNQSFPSFGQITITAKKLVGLTHVSDELFEDTNIELGQLIIELFGRELAKEEDKQCFLGTGANGDPFIGVLRLPIANAPEGEQVMNVVVMDNNRTDFSQISADDLLAMITKTPQPALQDACFYMHRSIFDAVRKLKTTTGEYIYAQPNGPATVGTIWGYPVKMPEIMPGSGATAANTPFVTFGNLKHMVMGERHAQEIARSSEYAFDQMQTFIRVHERLAFKALRNDAFTALFTAPNP